MRETLFQFNQKQRIRSSRRVPPSVVFPSTQQTLIASTYTNEEGSCGKTGDAIIRFDPPIAALFPAMTKLARQKFSYWWPG
ncbi:hypothetical protein SBA5_10033 [Candidatus Sulfotelmatomonas gaucii]|uniref:Uncharacterized protein n=1 Tax=Candidatus Sulfuritelmatomonas gaucii TaxID=2043161 RepID=A0A2N9L1Z0_9BACT|nr:hypothetical protein SBA5_10033 [Candidatus Sulfotelmatomonas gaucii]